MIKLIFFNICFLLLLLTGSQCAKAQNFKLKQEVNFTTREIYDLLIDKQGFLWIASDIGIARYDGNSYMNFTNSLQFSLGCTGLVQDKYGRVWFNNFLGQIFYIENEKVHFVKEYDYKTEHTFPHIGLFNDQIIATSDKGLFVMNTSTLKSKYVHATNSATSATSSLAIFSNNVVAMKGNNWYLYKPDGSLKQVPFAGDNRNIFKNVINLSTATYRDTAYLTCNPSGILKKLVVKNDTVRECSVSVYKSFINTISITPNNQWINTVAASYSLSDNKEILGYNLSDVVKDHEGNTWYSSLNHGLLVNYYENITESTQIPLMDSSDMALSIVKYKDRLLIGTQNGMLLLYNPLLKTTDWKINLGGTSGSITNISAIGNEDFMISSSTLTYRLNVPTKQVTRLPDIQAVKQVFDTDDITYLAAAGGVYLLPKTNNDSTKQLMQKRFGNVFKYNPAHNYYYLNNRCRSVCYYPETQSLLVSFKDGLYQVNKDGMLPVYYNRMQVFAASLLYINHKMFIGTINNGLLIMDHAKIQHITAADGLFSTTIFRFKSIGDHLWIIGSGALQLFDSRHLTLIKKYKLPSRFKAQVSDLDEQNNLVYLTTYSGLFAFPLKEVPKKNLENYLLEIKVGKDSLVDHQPLSLPYTKNTVTFKIGVPAYNDAKDIYIKYCLITKADSIWQMTEPGERTISFSSLMPGNYRFKAYAVNPKLGASKSIISYDFKISPPWWNALWVKITFYVLIVLLILSMVITFNFKKQQLKNMLILQQELVRMERQRISGEIHDDIGSGIFAIHLFAELASKKKDSADEIKQISTMINEISDKIKEIIWSTNVENDNLENLIYFIQFQATKLFDNTEIEFRSNIPDEIADSDINIQNRRNIYLTIKELVHNAIKHAKATQISLNIDISDESLIFEIKDNGVGFDPAVVKPNGMGLENVRSRVKRLKGSFIIQNNHGTIITIKVPLSEISLDFATPQKKRFFFF